MINATLRKEFYSLKSIPVDVFYSCDIFVETFEFFLCFYPAEVDIGQSLKGIAILLHVHILSFKEK